MILYGYNVSFNLPNMIFDDILIVTNNKSVHRVFDYFRLWSIILYSHKKLIKSSVIVCIYFSL